MRWLVLALSVAACGAPSQQTTNTVAAGAALAAGAATVADPDGAAKRNENKGKGGEPGMKGKKVDETVPPDVLDRLDQAEAEDAQDGSSRDADSSKRHR
jgi:hypothetical protein